ncbi:MAG TPA: four helix bundle protein [Saprospiraceae bacterium]|nr:four helix bundle protein [Saprospiraceae bacterium]
MEFWIFIGNLQYLLTKTNEIWEISKGSSAEVITQLNIANRLGYINADKLYELEKLAEKNRASLKNLIKARGGDNLVKVISWFILSLFLPR